MKIFAKITLTLGILAFSQSIFAQQILWTGNVNEPDTKPTSRIPALVSAPDGTLFAFADNRPTRDDIGHGEVDIQLRRSIDQGIHWTKAQTIANGTERCGYSDPAVVVDCGGSGKILMMCAAGNVTYANSNSNNKLKVWKFSSNDNGKTWNDDGEQTTTIYNKLGSSVVRAFFTSGKITQSRTKKVGSYNRIYSAIVTNKGNYVLYSDDFGGSWDILGGTVAQSGSNADEAHVIELPNEDLLLVSKTSSNRYVNLYSYKTNSWGQSGQKNNTIATNCNGDIDIISAFDQSGNAVSVLVQSAPKSSSPRRNITYYYKAISKTDSYQLSDFTTGWTEGKVVCSTASSYSSLYHIGNGVEAIFYEKAENTSASSDPKGYNLVYQTNTISDITGGKYISVPADNATIVRMAPKGEMVDVSKEVYPFVPTTLGVNDIKGKDVEFMILSADGQYGFSYQKATPVKVNSFQSYTDQPNTDGNLYTFKMDNEGYITCVGRDQYLNRDVWSRSVSLENSKETKWTLEKDGDKFRISFKPALITYYLNITTNSITYSESSSNKVIILTRSTTPVIENEQEFAKLSPVDIEIKATEGYGTYYRADDAYMMPNGLTGFFIEDAKKVGKLSLETRYDAGSVVPAGTALILYGNPGKYQATLYQANNDGNELARKWNDANLNQLEGHRDGYTTASEKGVPVYYYKLAYGDSGVLGFYWGADDGEAFDIPNLNTAYLAVAKSEASKVRGFSLPDDPTSTTSIQHIAIDEPRATPSILFNMNGHRVDGAHTLPSGIYISNGKKTFVK